MSNIIFSSIKPTFIAQTSATQTNVTGDGTTYQCVFQNLLQGSGYNTSTGVFTAPIAGRYFFDLKLDMSQLTASFTTGICYLVTTGGSFLLNEGNPGACRTQASTFMFWHASIDVIMNLNDTAYITIMLSGGTKTAGMGNGVGATWLGGRYI